MSWTCTSFTMCWMMVMSTHTLYLKKRGSICCSQPRQWLRRVRRCLMWNYTLTYRSWDEPLCSNLCSKWGLSVMLIDYTIVLFPREVMMWPTWTSSTKSKMIMWPTSLWFLNGKMMLRPTQTLSSMGVMMVFSLHPGCQPTRISLLRGRVDYPIT
jgi:hypothetical protein